MQPTTTELEILKLLWKAQPQTARDLHQQMEQQFNWSYSSTRKTLERMGEKGFIHSADQGNKKIYSAKLEKISTLAAFARDFASRVFELETPLPVAMFSDSKMMSAKEITELEKLLQQPDQEK